VKSHRFPDSFLWGAATSAYQIEGSPLADGAGQSIWHRFVRTPNLVQDGDTGDVACDHYQRMKDDVAMMKRLGLTAYRFSIAWARILPQGRGAVNEAGLGFYERLVDTLLEAGIEPMATLYHWDLPAALDDRGGWLNPDVADWFSDYATVMYKRLDDRVKLWTTLNEPWVVADGGYLQGTLAPGHRNRFEAPIASHQLLRSHGKAVQAYRAVGKHQVGLVVNLAPKHAATDKPEDIAAARRADAYMNRQYLDPVFLGHYPPEMTEIFGEAWPEWPAEDFKLIGEPIDFVGINYYMRDMIRHEETAWPVKTAVVRQTQSTYTATGWEVYPQGLTEILAWVKHRYGNVPQYVTENGAAFYDPPKADAGVVSDPLRKAYYRGHLRAIHDAIEQGVDLRGYCAWSLMDNLEWALGFSKRFGLVHVNFETQERTLKDSAHFYAQVIATKGGALDGND
jgi:beta-glucosidase